MMRKIFIIFLIGLFSGLFITVLVLEQKRREHRLIMERAEGELLAQRVSNRFLRAQLEQRNLEHKLLKGKNGRVIRRLNKKQKECIGDKKLELRVTDPDKRWIFQDTNVMDDVPGELILTEKFFRDARAELCPKGALDKASPFSGSRNLQKKRLKNRLSVGISPDHYQLEYSFKPFALNFTKAELGFEINPRVERSFFAPLYSLDFNAGVYIRW